MSLRKRLRRLERGGILPCPECDSFRDDKLEIRISEATDKEEGIEHCPRCGRISGGLVKLKWT